MQSHNFNEQGLIICDQPLLYRRLSYLNFKLIERTILPIFRTFNRCLQSQTSLCYLVDGHIVNSNLTADSATFFAGLGRGIGLGSLSPSVLYKTVHRVRVVEHEDDAKVFRTKTQAKPSLTHFHIGVIIGSVVLNNSVPTTEAGKKYVDVGVTEDSITGSVRELRLNVELDFVEVG
jgi:hypothetical protein